MPDYAENDYAVLQISRGVLSLTYKPGVFINLKVARRVTTDRLILQKRRAYPVFADLRQVTGADKAARDYFAAEGAMLMRGVGALIGSETTRLIVAIYQKASRPVVPVQVFTDKKEALKYLQKFKPPAPKKRGKLYSG